MSLCEYCKRDQGIINEGEKCLTWKVSENYKTWTALHDDITHSCGIVVKTDCVGHAAKNFNAKLEKSAIVIEEKSINRWKY